MAADQALPTRDTRTGEDLITHRPGPVTVGHLATRDVVTARPGWTLRAAAEEMHGRGVGSVVVLDERDELAGILTERDLLASMATGQDPDAVTVADLMTTEVVTAGVDWQVYEATAEMTDHHIRHLVITAGRDVVGMVSIRDVLLAGQRVELGDGDWAVLRDPLTFTLRERRRLQRALLRLEPGPAGQVDVGPLIGELVGSWSYDVPLPPGGDELASLPESARRKLDAAIREELPGLQRIVQPSPGWRHFDR